MRLDVSRAFILRRRGNFLERVAALAAEQRSGES